MSDDFKKLRNLINLQSFFLFLQVGLFAWFIVSVMRSGEEDKVSVTQNANPEIVTNVSGPGRLDEIKERADRRGYFSKSEFSEIMGFSVRTLERRIQEGRLSPPPVYTEAGEVQIPLDATVAPH